MTVSHSHTHIFIALLLLLSTFTHSETIKLSQAPASQGLFANMRSTFEQAQDQTSSLGSLFSTDSFFTSAPQKKSNKKGANVIEGSGNQLHGYNNKVSGQDNSLIGAESTIVGDLNKAFGLGNTIFGSKN